HVQGDVVLRSIARCIRDSIRSCDTAARFGGEEFLVLLPETDLKSGAIFAERLRKKIEATAITLENDSIRITISIGVSTLDPANQAATKEHLLDAADRALYQSKKTGKNKVSVIPL
ncbi:MAG TPA: GGDEF domain-containing protein, partial [Dissulfurispiraceae bacterium]|nr:GGDEF domain-containing protein [Dissulfurispiraceae bacterium]